MSQSEQAVSGVFRQPLPSIKHQPRLSMPATIILFTPATSLSEAAEKQNCAPTLRRTKAIRVSSLNKPEARLWKVSAQQGSLGAAIIEQFVLAVFLLIALLLIAGVLLNCTNCCRRMRLGKWPGKRFRDRAAPQGFPPKKKIQPGATATCV